MSFNIKDPLFGFSGEPGIIRKFDKNSGRVVVDNKKEDVNHELRHGYVKGMTPEQKHDFNTFMDQLKTVENIDEQVQLLQKKVSELTSDINPNSSILLGYYKSELSHLMHTSNYIPRYYKIDPTKVP